MKDRQFMWQMIGFALLCLIPIGMLVLYAVWKPFGILTGLIVLSLLISPIVIILSKSDSHTGGFTERSKKSTSTTKAETKPVKNLEKIAKPEIPEHKREMKEFEKYAFWVNVLDDDDL